MYKVGDKVKLVKDLPDSYECNSGQTIHLDHVEHSVKASKGDVGVVVPDLKVKAPRRCTNTYPVYHSNKVIRYEERSIVISSRMILVAFNTDSASKGVYDRICEIDDIKKVNNNHKVGKQVKTKAAKPKSKRKAAKANIIDAVDFTKIGRRT